MKDDLSPNESGQRPKSRVSVPNPLIPPLRDPRRWVRLISEITGQPEPMVQDRLRRESTHLGWSVREELDRREIPRYVWSDALVEFYEQTDAFLYESLVWNVTLQKNKMRRWIAEFLLRRFDGPADILLYGDGLCIDSYYLASAGHRVSSFEVSQHCTRFARSILEADEVKVTIYDDFSIVPSDRFDIVICLDVLEHTPDPPALVQEISRCLRPGGYQIVHAPFFFVHPSVPTHLRSNRRYSGDLRRLYGPANLTPVGGRTFWDPIVLWKRTEQTLAGETAIATWWRLRLAGMLLSVGRFWSAPFSMIAQRLTRTREICITAALEDNLEPSPGG